MLGGKPEISRASVVWGLVIFTVIYRVIASHFPALSNTSPTMALCFGGGLLLGRKFWWVPPVLILSSDFLIGIFRGSDSGVGWYTLMTVVLFTSASWLGARASRWNGSTWPMLWCGVLLSSVVFYAAANTFSWALFAGYEKSFAGWWQSQTTGLPQFSPQSWVFLRNALIGDTIWCLIAGLLFFARRVFFTAPELVETS